MLKFELAFQNFVLQFNALSILKITNVQMIQLALEYLFLSL